MALKKQLFIKVFGHGIEMNRPVTTKTIKDYHMNNLLYVIAVVLIIGWILGFFVYSASGLIHLLLVIALIAIVLRLIRGDRV